MMNDLDYRVRVAVSKWTRDTAHSGGAGPDQAKRLGLAKRTAEGLAVREDVGPSAILPSILLMVREIMDPEAGPEAVAPAVAEAMEVFILLGAFQ